MSAKAFIIVLCYMVSMIHTSTSFQTIECKDGNLFGVKELVDEVEQTVERCTNSSTNKAEMFGCIFKGLDMFHEEKPAVEKVKGFFERIFTSKIMTAAKELTDKLMQCAQDYVKSFDAMKSMDEIGKTGEAFSSCFFEATKKYTYIIRNECQPKGATASTTE